MSGVKQYGDVMSFPRTDPLDKVIVAAIPRVLKQLAGTVKELGIPLETALAGLKVYYVPAVEGPGGSHSDPLMLRERSDLPTVREDQLVAWKFAVWHEDDVKAEPLVEGTSIR